MEMFSNIGFWNLRNFEPEWLRCRVTDVSSTALRFGLGRFTLKVDTFDRQ